MNSLTSISNNPFASVCEWLQAVEIHDRTVARLLCKIIPAQCPFEREIKIRDRTIVYIPPLCKLNPFYAQIAEIRFKSLSFLADDCGEDITFYC